MSPFALLILAIPTLTAAWWFWADRRLKSLHAGLLWRLMLAVVPCSVIVGIAWVLFGRGQVLVDPVPPKLYALVLIWSLLALPGIALPMMFGWSVWAIVRRKKHTAQSSLNSPGWTRRKWLGTAALALPPVTAVVATAYSLFEVNHFRLRKISVSLADLPLALDGLRLAHVTDTHVGKFTRGPALPAIAAAVNRLQADLVLFTGDLIDNTLRDLPAAVEMLKSFQPADRLVVIEGNHDLFDNPVAFESGVRASGLTLLRNQAITFTIRGVSVQVLGITWHHEDAELAACVDTVAALRDPRAFPILLSHHPHAFDRATERDFPLTLAGHTHGGQLMLTPGFGAGSLMFRYWSGLYRKLGRALVVSNGTGNWFPLRVNAPAEIIEITLRRNPQPVAGTANDHRPQGEI